MPEIQMDTDELNKLALRLNREVVDGILGAQQRIATATELISPERSYQRAFSSLAGNKIMQAAGQFRAPLDRLSEAREKLALAARYFEEIDATGVERWQRYPSDYPDWLRNRDFALLLTLNLTAEEIAAFYRYGNLLSIDSTLIPDLLVFLRREYDEIKPGTPEAELLLSLLDPFTIKPGTPEAEFYLGLMEFQNVLPGTHHAKIFLALVEVEKLEWETPAATAFVNLVESEYGLSFQPKNSKWDPVTDWRTRPVTRQPAWEKLMCAEAVFLTGEKFYSELKKSDPNAMQIKSQADAFKMVYGITERKPMTIVYDPDDAICMGRGMRCDGPRNIVMVTMSGSGRKDPAIRDQMGRNNLIHELGHAFTNVWVQKDGSWPPEKPDKVLGSEGYEVKQVLLSDRGFCGHAAESGVITTWRQHPPSESDPTPAAGEYFADMFLGWVGDSWAPPPDTPEDIQAAATRKEWMDGHMPAWIQEAPGHHCV